MGCFIKYSPVLSHNLGSDRSAIILDRLEYWFSKYSSFYKFIEPCSHPCYREGDSLQEELSISRKVFNKAFDLIGVRYKSKTAFMEEKDPFKGKLYAMYMDRQTHKTYFVRNNKFASSILGKLFSPLKKTPDSQKNKGCSRNLQKGNSSIYKDKQINTSSSSKNENVSESIETKKTEEILDIWEKEVGEVEKNENISPHLLRNLRESFKINFYGSLENWTSYCKKIASSKFLMGEGGNAFFKKAWLSWAIKKENIEKINTGHFTVGDRQTVEKIVAQEKDEKVFNLRKEKKQIEREIQEEKQYFEREKHSLSKAIYSELNKKDRDALERSFVEHIQQNSPTQYETYKNYGVGHPILSMSYEWFLRETIFETFSVKEYEELKINNEVRLTQLKAKICELENLIESNLVHFDEDLAA